MRIRVADQTDLDLVGRMRLAFLAEIRDMAVGEFSDAFIAETRAYLERHHAAGTIRTWLAETDHCIGIVSMLVRDMPPMPDDPRTHEGYLVHMYVEPNQRGAGVGRALLTACRDAGAQDTVRKLLLYATEDGRPLYESSGFQVNENLLELPLEPRG